MGLLNRRSGAASSPAKAVGGSSSSNAAAVSSGVVELTNGRQSPLPDDSKRSKKHRSLEWWLRYWNAKLGTFSITVIILALAATLLLLLTGVMTRQRSSNSLRLSTRHHRQHNVLYWNLHTKRYTNILVAAPVSARTKKRLRRLNYYDPNHHEPHSRINFKDPDHGEAFEVPEVDRQCYPMASWQTEHHETCNTIHEVDMDGHEELEFINCGASRCTFVIPNNYHNNKIVLKMTKLKKWGFVPDKYEKAIKDSLALEHLTSSPYSVQIYSSCAVSQFVEYSKGGNIHDLLKRSRLQERMGNGDSIDSQKESRKIHFANPASYQRHQLTSPLTKLKIAYQVTTAVADMHSLEQHNNGLPSMVHNDLCCHQFMLVDGVYKLGDFDWVTFQTQTMPADSSNDGRSSSLRKQPLEEESSKPEVCQTTPISFALEYLKVLAPEEQAYYENLQQAREKLMDEGEDPVLLESAENATPKRTYRDKLDIYQVGNICYTLLTNWWMWEGYTIGHALLAIHQVHTPVTMRLEWCDLHSRCSFQNCTPYLLTILLFFFFFAGCKTSASTDTR